MKHASPTVSLRGAAEYLGLSAATVSRYIKLGQGPAHIRISDRLLRFRIEDLDQYMEERLVPSGRAGSIARDETLESEG